MLSETTPQPEAVNACDPSGLTPDQMKYWVETIIPNLYRAVQEVQELTDGYAFRLPSSSEILLLLAEDLNMERLCCPFVRYTVEIEPNRGPFWLRMTGGEGVKEYLRMSFEAANLFDEKVAKAAGFSIAASAEMDSVETVLGTIDSINERFAARQG